MLLLKSQLCGLPSSESAKSAHFVSFLSCPRLLWSERTGTSALNGTKLRLSFSMEMSSGKGTCFVWAPFSIVAFSLLFVALILMILNTGAGWMSSLSSRFSAGLSVSADFGG